MQADRGKKTRPKDKFADLKYEQNNVIAYLVYKERPKHSNRWLWVVSDHVFPCYFE